MPLRPTKVGFICPIDGVTRLEITDGALCWCSGCGTVFRLRAADGQVVRVGLLALGIITP